MGENHFHIFFEKVIFSVGKQDKHMIKILGRSAGLMV